MLFIYMIIAAAQLRLRAKLEREAPERLQVKMWLYPYGTWAALAGMAGVLLLMGLSDKHAMELWASIIVTAIFLISYWVKLQVQAKSNG
jgi:GABA permease